MIACILYNITGPDKYIEKLKVYVDSADVTFASDSMMRVLRGVIQWCTYCITTLGPLSSDLRCINIH